ncbi:MAG: hypothetical protein HY327_04120 [Chloroflexi bacterium]|nr:hypothetical protein [Chloroflexota bacterium]
MSSQIEHPTQSRGTWRTLAQLLWLVLVVAQIALWVIGETIRILDPYPDCVRLICDPMEFGAQDLTVIRAMGWSPSILALISSGIEVVTGLAFFALAMIIFARRRSEWIALLVAYALVFLGALFFTSANDALGRVDAFRIIPLDLLFGLGVMAFVMLLFVFPDGRFVPRWSVAFLLPMLPIAILTNSITALVIPVVALAIGMTIPVAGLVTQIYRYARISDAVQRQQTKWVVFGFSSAIALMVVWLFSLANFPANQPSPARVTAMLIVAPTITLLGLLLPLSIAISIMRYRLWDIDLLIRRTLIYSALTAILAVFYFGTVVLLQQIFRALTGQSSELAVIVSTLAIAALFNPLRHRVQNAIDRRFYRRKYDAARVLAQFAATARDEVELSKLNDRLVQVVQETMQPTSVSLWLKTTKK